MTKLRRFLREFHDNALTWPSVKLTLHVPPWHWQAVPDFYHDGVNGHAYMIRWLFAEFWIGWNNPPFVWEKNLDQDPA